MSIDLTKILLREKSNPNYVAKGSSLTWDEEDTNFILLGDAVRELQTPSDSGFSPYDNSKTYSNVLPDYVSYNGNIYEYIKAFPQSGVTPGSDPLTWKVASVGQFSHQQNTDQFIDFGGPFQASAQEIYTIIHSTQPDQIFKGEWVGTGSPAEAYLAGDVVLHSLIIWEASADNSGEEPGTGMSWTPQGFFQGTYGPSWNGLLPISGADIYAKFEGLTAELETDFDSIYLRLDGLYDMTGDLDMNMHNIANGGIITALNGLSTDGVASIFSDTVNNNFFAGLNAGNAQIGTNVNAFGPGAGAHNSGNDVNAFGPGAGTSSSGTYVNAFGINACYGQTGNQVNAYGPSSCFGNTGSSVDAMGSNSAWQNSGNDVKAFGADSAKLNTLDEICAISYIKDLFLNNVGDNGSTVMQNVNIQTAMAVNGTDSSASASTLSFASARGTGAGNSGNLQWMYSPPLATGATRQSLTLGAEMLGPSGEFRFANTVYFGSAKNTAGSGRLYFVPGAGPGGSGASFNFEYYDTLLSSYQTVLDIS